MCRFCFDQLPSADCRLRRAQCFDFSIFVDVYFNPLSEGSNKFGFLIVNSNDSFLGSFIRPLVGCTNDGYFLALSHCFDSIVTTFKSDSSRRTFQIVHRCPGVVRSITRRNVVGTDRLLANAQSLLSKIPPEIWIVWDGGRRAKTDAHFGHLRKLLRPTPPPNS